MIKHKITDKEKEIVNGGIAVEETKEPVVPVGDTTPKSLVVKHPVFTTIFTTNDVLRILRFAAICRVRPEF